MEFVCLVYQVLQAFHGTQTSAQPPNCFNRHGVNLPIAHLPLTMIDDTCNACSAAARELLQLVQGTRWGTGMDELQQQQV